MACPWLSRNSGCFGVACFFSSPSSSSASPSSSPSRHHHRRHQSASSSSPVCPRQSSSSSSSPSPPSSSSSPSILIAVIAIVIIVTVNIIVIAISRLRSFCDHAAVPAQAEVARGRRRGRGNVRCNTHPRCPPVPGADEEPPVCDTPIVDGWRKKKAWRVCYPVRGAGGVRRAGRARPRKSEQRKQQGPWLSVADGNSVLSERRSETLLQVRGCCLCLAPLGFRADLEQLLRPRKFIITVWTCARTAFDIIYELHMDLPMAVHKFKREGRVSQRRRGEWSGDYC